jgi:putative Mg2+ transporter-C (MgtC) family protein
MVGWDEVSLRLAAALALGSLIGAERQWRHHMAGLQTNALVAVGAASFVVISSSIGADSSSLGRIAAQVASGIGFLGAGVIMRQGLSVHGLNTAATLWCSAAIGVLAGAGGLEQAALASGFVILANLALHPMADLINRHRQPPGAESEIEYVVRASCQAADEIRVRALLLQGGGGLTLIRLQSRRPADAAEIEVEATFVAPLRDDQAVEQAVARLSLEAGVSAAQWRITPRHEQDGQEP